MSLHVSKIIFIFLFIIFNTYSSAQTAKQVNENIKIIGTAYGYLKYFYPVKDVSENNWNYLLYLAINNGKACKTNTELISLLTKIFKPIAPNIIFFDSTSIKFSSAQSRFKPDTDRASHCTFWQHIGNGNSFADIYKSAIVNQDGQDLLYPEQANELTVINKCLGNGLFISFPRVICFNGSNIQNTFQKDSILKIAVLKFPEHPGISDIDVRLVNVMKAWTVFQHFFPYWDDVTIDKDSMLSSTLNKCYVDKTEGDFLKTLQLMTAPLNDGHIQISDASTFNNTSYTVGFSVDWFENSIIVNHVYNDKLTEIKKGDIILKVDDLSRKEILLQEKYLSGSKQYKRYLLTTDLFSGTQNSSVKITFYSAFNKRIEKITAQRNILKFDPSTGEDWTINFSERKSGKINDSIYYLDLRNISKDSLESIILLLNNFKNVICDLRGYPPLYSIELLNHLLIKPDTAQHWLQTPLISFPDFEMVKYRYSGYSNLHTNFPTLKSRFFFLCNSSSISYTELLLAIIKQNKLGIIVGTPSAGTNGNINLIELLDNYYCYYTGMRVVNPDGSKHHLIGVIPNIIVEPNISSIRRGEDNVFEAALQTANEKTHNF